VTDEIELTVVIPALHEGPNLSILVPSLREVLEELGIRHQILVVTEAADRETAEAAARSGAGVVEQREPGYGRALVEGFEAARGRYILTMDADLSHRPNFVRDLWAARHDAEVTIASRYVPGAGATMPALRRLLSRTLNVVFCRGLALPIRDMSSGFRLYRASVVHGLPLRGRHFDVLQEILVRTYAEGWRVQEKPFHYAPRAHGRSQARVVGFGLAYLKTFGRLWKLRNSILAADYDDRAYDSAIPIQRYWQRARFRHVTGLIPDDRPVLDVGCGSSRIIGALPPGSVGLDILHRKLRYARKFSRFLVQASGFQLPFPDHSFSCVVCSQVIEHVPKDPAILDELCRVLAPGGRLILGTPDYARWEWVVTEAVYGWIVPGGYADEHIAHYTRRGLIDEFARRGFALEATRYIMRGELILALRKPECPARVSAEVADMPSARNTPVASRG
jgi:dolichol-phosphate mannosyltransferase